MTTLLGSVRRKMLVVVMSATGAALLLCAAALFAYEVRSVRQAGLEDLQSQADLLAQSLAPALAFDDARAAREALGALRVRPQIESAAVLNARGDVFAEYALPEATRVHWPAALPPEGVRFGLQDAEVVHRIRQAGETLGTLVLRSRHDLAGRALDYLWLLTLAIVAGQLFAALIFRKLHPLITRPILAVAEVSRRVIADRDYTLRVPVTSNDEVGVLVDAFNRMLDDLSREMRERGAAEEALRAADRRKDEFLATLAHELRNPLAPLANGLKLLDRAGDDPKVRQTAQAMMQRQLAQLVRLIDDLLDVSRITRGKVELRREIIDVAALAARALEAAEPMLRQRTHAVSFERPDEPVWVDADPARLTQVLVNLLHNAARYTEPGGRIALAVQPLDGRVRLAVRDNGIGIDARQQAAIFDMFVQVDTSLERGAAGLGIGLTIARELVAMHGGRLGVDSAGLGKGSTFSVELPTVAAPAAAAPPAPVQTAAPKPLDVLIADDNADFAGSLGEILRLAGHRVRVVHDGAAALQEAQRSPPDAAFLDIGIPSVNGYRIAESLRTRPQTRDMLLIAVTGWGQEADRRRVKEAGFDHHLVKPIDTDQALGLLAQRERAASRPKAHAARG